MEAKMNQDRHSGNNEKRLLHQTALVANIRTIANIESYVRELPDVVKVKETGKEEDYTGMGINKSSDNFYRIWMIPVEGGKSNKMVGLKFWYDNRAKMGEMTILNRSSIEMNDLLAQNEQLKIKIVQAMFRNGSGFQVIVQDGHIRFLCPCCMMEVEHECRAKDLQPHMFSHYGSEVLKTIERRKGNGKEKEKRV
jgi:hypothetical protein